MRHGGKKVCILYFASSILCLVISSHRIELEFRALPPSAARQGEV